MMLGFLGIASLVDSLWMLLLALPRNSMERRFLDQRVSACERGDTQQAYHERFWNRQLVSSKTHLEATRKIETEELIPRVRDAQALRDYLGTRNPVGSFKPGTQIARRTH
jgi:hypothetical protein